MAVDWPNPVESTNDMTTSHHTLDMPLEELEDLKYVLDVSTIVAITDKQGIIAYANDAFCKISKYSRQELLGQNHRIINSGYHPHEFFKEMWATIGSGQVWRADIKNKSKDGTYYWVDTTLVPFLDSDGKPHQYIAIFHDITHQKQAEEEVQILNGELEQQALKRTLELQNEIALRQDTEKTLQLNEERFRSLVGVVQDYSILMLDPEGYILTWNEGAERIKGYPASEVIGKHFSIFYPPEVVRTSFPEQELEISKTQGRFEDEGWRVKKDGSQFWANVVITAIYNREGKLMGYSKITRDLTQRKALEQESLKRNQQLEAVNKELEAFSYSVSHDLRTPLRSIEGFSQRILKTKSDQLDGEGKEYLGYICESSQEMAQLIDDLLNLSRLSRAEFRKERINLSELAQETLEQFREQETGRSVETHIQEGLYAEVDPHLLRVVFKNILGNAWKFTGHKPNPVIEFGQTEQDGKKVYFVRDNGAGFDMAYASKLFGAFQRLHDANEFPGTGIGLATVQRIIHRHGGSIWANSAVNEGATFYFTL